jgi:2-phosphoglycolate phosphatase
LPLRFRAVLFDLDGTLIDSSRDLVASVQYALRRVDRRDPPNAETILIEVGKPLELILRDLGYPTDEESTTTFVDTYRAHYAKHFKEHTVLYPGVEETLGFLKEVGVRMALVTTKHQVQADFTAQACGLAGYFDYVHGFLEGRQHKPHPKPILSALQRLSAAPEEALTVGDTEQDVEAGRAAGTATCAVAYGFRPLDILIRLRPDFIVPRITDVVPIVTS